MVLEMKVPHTKNIMELLPILPVFLSYLLSFIYIGIYWNNHHHLLHAVTHINGRVMWANMHLLFWLSLIPFTSGWMGENHFSKWPVALYGFVLLMNSVAYYILTRTLSHIHGKNDTLARAIGKDFKGTASAGIYVLAVY